VNYLFLAIGIAGEILKLVIFSQQSVGGASTRGLPLLHIQRLSPKVWNVTFRRYLGGLRFVGEVMPCASRKGFFWVKRPFRLYFR